MGRVLHKPKARGSVTAKAALASGLLLDLRVVVYRYVDGDREDWLAECLELGLIEQGKTRDQAIVDLVGNCVFQFKVLAEDGKLSSLFQAPSLQTWKLFAGGAVVSSVKINKATLRLIERLEVREASEVVHEETT